LAKELLVQILHDIPPESQGCFVMLLVDMQSYLQRNILKENWQFILQKFDINTSIQAAFMCCLPNIHNSETTENMTYVDITFFTQNDISHHLPKL
jgi:ornithine carbamoyltransferase